MLVVSGDDTKFNSRKEVVIGETYLGIQIFRFYFKCTKCSAELTMKTDPQNSDYILKPGAARNFEPWHDEEDATEREKTENLFVKRLDERSYERMRAGVGPVDPPRAPPPLFSLGARKMGDAMKSLENRAMDSKQDMDIAALEERKSMKSRHVSVDDMLAALKHSSYEKEKRIMDEIDKADEEVLKSIIFPGSKDYVRRNEDEDLEVDLHQPSSSLSQSSENNSEGKSTSGLPSVAGKPTDTLTIASIFNSSKNGETLGGSSIPKPKFILNPRSVTDGPPNKKLVTESAVYGQPKSEEERKSDPTSGSKMSNGLASKL